MGAQKVLKPEGKVLIIVDNREFQTKVVRELSRLGCIMTPKQLEVGDYILSERVCVERKTSSDFVNSVIDGRLFSQLKELLRNFEKPLLIIEGNNLYIHRNVHPNALRGALASVAVDYRVPILWTSSEEETASLLYWIARREQMEEQRSISIRGSKKPMSPDEQQEYLISGLPNVNSKIAKRLLEFFGTPEKVFTATEKELQKVEGIGKVLAGRIRNILTKKYRGD
ncbi:MAG: hypothetical protein DRP11_02630 [Candidatus Aenigmatarchaeota archaeon]|nr:MAG: hypothetical protein DRP11_02630 [Candidatus Aenigmarchaeota archaeon]